MNSSSSHSKAVVCIHWLQSKCWKEENCPYLHSYEGAVLPLCPAVARLGYCPYYSCHCRHPQSEKPCPRYQLGFCKFGPACTLAHIRSDTPSAPSFPDWYFNQMVAIFGLQEELSRDSSPFACSTSTVSSHSTTHLLLSVSRKCLGKESLRLKDEAVRALLVDSVRSADKVLLVLVSLKSKELFGLAEVTEVRAPEKCRYNWLKRCLCTLPTPVTPGILPIATAERLQALIYKQTGYHKRPRKESYKGYHEYQALCQKYENTGT